MFLKLLASIFFLSALTNMALAEEELDGSFLFDCIEKGINVNNMVFTFPKNTQVPVRLVITGPLFKTEGINKLNIKMLENMFVKMMHDEFYMSLDKHHWEPMKSFLQADLTMDIDYSSLLQKPGILIIADVELKKD